MPQRFYSFLAKADGALTISMHAVKEYDQKVERLLTSIEPVRPVIGPGEGVVLAFPLSASALVANLSQLR
jgi:hypothetical protein